MQFINMKFLVENLKCSGCAQSISEALKKLKGVDSVEVYVETDEIMVKGNAEMVREIIAKELMRLGYPEVNTLNNWRLKLKSYTSCIRGRIKT